MRWQAFHVTLLSSIQPCAVGPAIQCAAARVARNVCHGTTQLTSAAAFCSAPQLSTSSHFHAQYFYRLIRLIFPLLRSLSPRRLSPLQALRILKLPIRNSAFLAHHHVCKYLCTKLRLVSTCCPLSTSEMLQVHLVFFITYPRWAAANDVAC